MSDYPERIYMKPDDLFRVATPAKDAIEYIQRPEIAAKRGDELEAEVERLRGLVKKAFSEGFWNGVATHRNLDSDELGEIKEGGWESSRARKALNTEDEG